MQLNENRIWLLLRFVSPTGADYLLSGAVSDQEKNLAQFFKIFDKNEIEKLLYNFYVVKLNSVVTITITNR